MSEEVCWDVDKHCLTYNVLAQGRAIDPSLWKNVPLVSLGWLSIIRRTCERKFFSVFLERYSEETV